MVAQEDGGGPAEVSGAGVVAEAFPELEDVLEGCGGEGGGVRKTFEEAEKIGDDGVDAGLLEHDFGDPGRVGGAGFGAPGEGARIGGEPREEAVADGVADGANGLGFGGRHGGEDSAGRAGCAINLLYRRGAGV